MIVWWTLLAKECSCVVFARTNKSSIITHTSPCTYVSPQKLVTSSISMTVGEQNPPYDRNITYTLHTHTVKNMVCFHSNMEVLLWKHNSL